MSSIYVGDILLSVRASHEYFASVYPVSLVKIYYSLNQSSKCTVFAS